MLSRKTKVMRILCPIFVSFLALAIILTSLAMTMGRGAMAAEGQLCAVTGATPLVLAHDGLPLLDADGDPVALANPICPDCVIGAVALVNRPDLPGPADAQATTLAATTQTHYLPSRWRMGGEGRGPPTQA